MMLTVLMDLEFKTISPQRRVAIIETIAGYLGLPQVRSNLHNGHNRPVGLGAVPIKKKRKKTCSDPL